MGSKALGYSFSRNTRSRYRDHVDNSNSQGSEDFSRSSKLIRKINNISRSADKSSIDSTVRSIQRISKFLDEDSPSVQKHAVAAIAAILQDSTDTLSTKSNTGEIHRLLNVVEGISEHPSVKSNINNALAIRAPLETIALKLVNSQFAEEDTFVSNTTIDNQLNQFREGLQAATMSLLGDFGGEQLFSDFTSSSISLWGELDNNAPKDIKKIKSIATNVNKNDLSSFISAIEKLTEFLDSENPLVQKFALINLVKLIVDISKVVNKSENIGRYKPKDLRKLLKAIEKVQEHPVVQADSTSKRAIRKAVKQIKEALVEAQIAKQNKFSQAPKLFHNSDAYDKQIDEFRKGLQSATKSLLGGITREQYIDTMHSATMSLIGEA